ncbi:glycosyltransferase [Rhodoplanes roseus]|uniref:Glycosyltransferase 2-like domain-containing protein n=1 Tax=Rhodoplanes roseus TaxID=29409 RepID=A0A327L1L2_9BRAD|nr:glycosyltransferase [Rhodoplanes roseus]RAI41588.1 hypothetical protein CH341_21335 [Rhodoplanes roseus]
MTTTNSEPLVSILIINHNYGQFLHQAIESVAAQDYPNIECIIVDNLSTDASVDIARQIIAGDPRFRLVTLDANYGQLGAFFRTFEECNGRYVTILDADDILFPAFVSSHVQVHLALPSPVALTSSNVVETDATGGVRSGRYPHFGSPLLWDCPGLVDRRDAPRVATVSDRQFDRMSPRVSAIPATQMGWFWGPGSANMYRHSILEAVCQQRATPYLRGADAYLNPFAHALGGTALIDSPLSFYRIHGSNYFAVRETVTGLRAGRPEFDALHLALAEETVDFMLGHAARFRPILGHDRFWEVLDQLARFGSGRTVFRSKAFLDSLVRHAAVVQASFSDRELARVLVENVKPTRLATLMPRLLLASPRLGLQLRVTLQSLADPLGRRRRRRARRHGRVAFHAQPAAGHPPKPHDFGTARLLTRDPPVFVTGITFDEWLGVAGAFGRRFGDTAAGFIVYPTWSIEDPDKIAAIGRAVQEHRRRHPAHRIVFIGNTRREADMLAGEGLPALFLNKNFFVSERVFHPIAEQEPEFDAVYNARFVPEKRHALAELIRTVGYLGYVSESHDEHQDEIALMARLVRENPSHRLLNPVVDRRPVRLDPAGVNRQINRARVGLILSEVEGANYASMEYMLAGLPVVSTPSAGGREVYFDPDYCIVCDPTPEAVAAAVETLKARNIPPEHIRQRTLAKLVPERRRFLDLVAQLHHKLGGGRFDAPEWPYAHLDTFLTFGSYEPYLDSLEQASVVSRGGTRPPGVRALLTDTAIAGR